MFVDFENNIGLLYEVVGSTHSCMVHGNLLLPQSEASSFLLSQHWSNWGSSFPKRSQLNELGRWFVTRPFWVVSISLMRGWSRDQPCRPRQFNENINEYASILLHFLASGLADHLGRQVVLLPLLRLSPLATLFGSITASPSSFGTGLILPLSFIARISTVDNVVSWLVVVVRWSGLRRRWRRRR